MICSFLFAIKVAVVTQQNTKRDAMDARSASNNFIQKHCAITSKVTRYRLESNFNFRFWIRSLGNLNFKNVQKSFIISLLFLFLTVSRENEVTQSRDRMSDCDKGQTSTAYGRMGKHLLSILYRWSRPTIFTDHFCGNGRTSGLVYVYVCISLSSDSNF